MRIRNQRSSLFCTWTVFGVPESSTARISSSSVVCFRVEEIWESGRSISWERIWKASPMAGVNFLMRSSVSLPVAVESDSFEFLRRYPRHERLVSFQIPVGLPRTPDEGIVTRPVDRRDVPEGLLYLCQLRGRTLPVAAAKFAAQIEAVLEAQAG